MPRYLNLDAFVKTDSLTGAKYYEQTCAPGDRTPVSGIYRRQGCGFESFARREDKLPGEAGCNSHSSLWRQPEGKGVKWRLIVATIDSNTAPDAST
jgi:hypothetical protein